ncbi:P-loop containing nucleoside triphosphate hydrolase protein [Lipomyces arxii]|uniref:P-loop containing nucleoside triphosphate hydrolase protein n=1 Tax=Lipomyces arxii TaxID=56418 RepID=UPI0034CD02A5
MFTRTDESTLHKKYYIHPPAQLPKTQIARPASRASVISPTAQTVRAPSPIKQATIARVSTPIRPVTPLVPASLRVPRERESSPTREPTHLQSRPRSVLRRPTSTAVLRESAPGSPKISETPSKRRPSSVLSMTSSLSRMRSIDSLAGQPSMNVRVLVRARPFLTREIANESKCLLAMDSPSGITTVYHPDEADAGSRHHKESKEFVFDESLWSVDKSNARNQYVDQEVLYNKVGKEFLNHSFEGYHTCILAYGQTGSGKSYTMIGTEDEPGIIPRTCFDLFERIEHMTTATTSFTVKVSYFEIYNEHVYDLLVPHPAEQPVPLKVRESPVDGPYVKDLTTFSVRSFVDVEKYLAQGNKMRATAATKMNETSSRSHAVFTLALKKIESDPVLDETTEETNSRIRFVDLAGSERANSTGATGTRLREGANINKSLTTLGRVIGVLAESALASKKKDIVPYRDSTLTWLLKESLGGNSKTAMIACVSPCDYDETLSTLRYASQAKHIRTRAVVNQDFISATERDEKLGEMQDTINKLQDAIAQTSSSHKQQTDAQMLELEKFRKVIAYYEDKAEVEESKRRTIMQENATVKTHNRLITEHIKELRREQEQTVNIIPDEYYDEYQALLDDTFVFGRELAADVALYVKPKLVLA